LIGHRDEKKPSMLLFCITLQHCGGDHAPKQALAKEQTYLQKRSDL